MNIQGREFTIGADPEIFMGKAGKFVSAHGAVPGDKGNPFPVENGAVQVDGMALEFNINPANSLQQFEGNLQSVQNTLKEMIGDYEFIEDCSVFFDQEFFDAVPHMNKVLGCEADYNGWSLSQTQPPDGDSLMRTAGGHVHIGGFFSNDPFDMDHFFSSGRLARILDEVLGVYSILWDKDDQRRSMYGKAGSFRPKTYGMEYRTLSNKWLFNKNLVKFVYSSVEEAINKMFDEEYEPDPVVKDIIDNSDREHKFFRNNPKVKLLGV